MVMTKMLFLNIFYLLSHKWGYVQQNWYIIPILNKLMSFSMNLYASFEKKLLLKYQFYNMLALTRRFKPKINMQGKMYDTNPRKSEKRKRLI